MVGHQVGAPGRATGAHFVPHGGVASEQERDFGGDTTEAVLADVASIEEVVHRRGSPLIPSIRDEEIDILRREVQFLKEYPRALPAELVRHVGADRTSAAAEVPVDLLC